MSSTPAPHLLFQERVGPGLGLWAAGAVVVGSVAIAYGAMLVRTAATVVLLIGGGIVVGLTFAFRRRITLTSDRLAVGSDSVPISEVTGAEPLDAVRARALAGPEADARARFTLRTGRPAVQVLLNRPDCPYWLISTTKPEELAAAVTDLVGHRSTGPGTIAT